MSADELLALADKVGREFATSASKGALFLEAWRLCGLESSGPKGRQTDPYRRFCKMLQVGAYESAAAMLVPDGFQWCVGDEDGKPFATVHKPDVYNELAECATPGLSLLVAALTARGEQP